MIQKENVYFSRRRTSSGYSLGELLIVVAVIALVAIGALLTYTRQIEKANDATRKDHLNRYKTMFEEYYSDKKCYPTQAEWDACACDSDCMAPYMDTLYCDPVQKQKYLYQPFIGEDGEADPCAGYRLYARLQNTSDDDIARVGCGPILGCGEGILANYNFGIAMGGQLTSSDFTPDSPATGPTSTPTPIPGSNFCLGDGSRLCNLKTGCAPDYDKRACNEVLIDDFHCQGFVDSDLCATLCKNNYETYRCPGTETLRCVPWKRPDCQ